jgi:hypothetical protein
MELYFFLFSSGVCTDLSYARNWYVINDGAINPFVQFRVAALQIVQWRRYA